MAQGVALVALAMKSNQRLDLALATDRIGFAG
jgi:hypothetical protein